MDQGDNNTKFFHRFANFRKKHNSIWDLKNVEVQWVSNQLEQEKETIVHFSILFKDLGSSIIASQLEVVKHFPSFFFCGGIEASWHSCHLI